MFLLRFSHSNNHLYVGNKKYRATCVVRNDLNGWRKSSEIVKTYPENGDRKPYYPRVFPTGVWEVTAPIWTTDPEYAPVKIPTLAHQNVLIWSEENGEYSEMTGEIQEDRFYHLHFCEGSSSTLGCIRLDSADDAIEIAKEIESQLSNNEKIYIEVTI